MNNAPAQTTYKDIAVGSAVSFTVTITPELVDAFAALSGDHNPLHMEEWYASETAFHGRIAHGMISGALFSRLIGMHLPGKYSLYLSQSLRFHGPIAIGTRVMISGTVTHKTDVHNTVTIHTTAEDASSKKILVSGDAMVRLLK